MMLPSILVAHIGAPAEIYGADLQLNPAAPYEDCNALISGRIGEGDASRIIQQLSNSEIHVYYVCFNSEGGSYQEALEIAEYLWGRHPTLVPSTARCYSACAIAFMGGGTFGESAPFANRSLEPGGQIGFHAPNLELPDAQFFNSQEVSHAYQLALHSINRLFESEAYFPPFVISKIVGTPPAAMMVLSTLGQARESGIRVLYNGVERAPFEEIGRRLCNAATQQREDDGGFNPASDRMGVVSGPRVANVDLVRTNQYRVVGEVGYVLTEEPWTCHFDFTISSDSFWGTVTDGSGARIPVSNLETFPQSFEISRLGSVLAHDATSLAVEFERHK